MSRHRTLFVSLIATAAILFMLFTSTRAGEALKLVIQYSSPGRMSPVVDPFLIELEERTFRFSGIRQTRKMG